MRSIKQAFCSQLCLQRLIFFIKHAQACIRHGLCIQLKGPISQIKIGTASDDHLHAIRWPKIHAAVILPKHNTAHRRLSILQRKIPVPGRVCLKIGKLSLHKQTLQHLIACNQSPRILVELCYADCHHIQQFF